MTAPMTEMKRSRGKRPNQRSGESGQATIEFALTAILLLGFVFFFLQLSLMFAWGNYVHYATFMAARAQLSAGPTQEDQVDRAKAVLVRTLKKGSGRAGQDRFPMIAMGSGSSDDIKGAEVGTGSAYAEGIRGSSWMEGVRYTFKSRLFFAGSTGTITLTSESWLGREPSSSECIDAMGEMKGIIDNGC